MTFLPPLRRPWAGVAGALVVAATFALVVSSASANMPTTLRIANEATIGSYDPTACGDTECRRFQNLSSGYLTRFPDGTPELAKSVTPSNGNKTWTATLRSGLKFSDGSPLAAKDVVASFKRYLEPPFKGTLGVMQEIASVTAKGSATVVFQLLQPDAEFRQSLTVHTAAIYPASKVSSKTFFQSPPISAGPYSVTSGNLTTNTFTLQANPHYYGPAPHIKQIVFTHVGEGGTRLAQVENGQVDYAKDLPANELKSLPSDLHIDPVHFPGGQVQILFNNSAESKSVTTNVRIRQAISLAVNRQQIASLAEDSAISGMKPLYGIPWPDVLDPKAADLAPAFPRDIQKAKQLLKGTPCEHGCTLKFINFNDFNWQLPPASQVVQQNLKDVGINVQLVNQSIASPLTDGGDWDAMVGDPGADVMTAASIATNGLVQYQWWTVPAKYQPVFPDLAKLNQELAVAPEGQQAAVIRKINTAFAKDMPWVPLTTLTFLDVSRQPTSVIQSPIGWVLNIA